MSLRRRTLLVNGALVVVLAGVGVVGWTTLASGSTTVSGRTATIQRGTVLSTVAATGTVVSPGDVGVSFASSGTVTAVKASVGDTVRKGQVLATIDDLSARQQLASARGQLANAKDQLATAEGTQTPSQKAQASASLQTASQQVSAARRNLDYTRSSNALNKQGYDRSVSQAQGSYDDAVSAQSTACAGGSSQACTQAKQATSQARQQLGTAKLTRRQDVLRDAKSLQDAQAQLSDTRTSYASTSNQNRLAGQPESALQIEAAVATVDSAQASVDSATAALAATTLRAPTAGIVASISGKVGDSASTGSGSTTGSTSTDTASGFVVLTGVSKLQVQASFSEADTASIKKDAGASVSFEALSGVTINAVVTSIAPLPTTSNGVTSYTVTLDMRTVPAGVRAGQTTTVTVVAKRATNVLYVPSAAVTSLGGRSTITMKSSGGTKTVDVTVGLKGDTTTEISGTGVTEGAQVVIATTSTSGTNGFPGGAVPGGLGGFTGGGPGTNR